MNPLTREELVEMGMSIQPGSLLRWAERLLTAARRHEVRLRSRGVDAARLSGIEDLIRKVRSEWTESGYKDEAPAQFAVRHHGLREDALAYKKEVTLMAKVAFGSQPDVLSTFRPGVPTGHLLANLANELKSEVGLLREHATRLADLGLTPDFIDRGELLIEALEKARGGQETEFGAMPPTVQQKYHDTGLLYDLIRTLVRTGQLEFRKNPSTAAEFTFRWASLNRGASSKPRSKGQRVADR